MTRVKWQEFLIESLSKNRVSEMKFMPNFMKICCKILKQAEIEIRDEDGVNEVFETNRKIAENL